MTEDGRPVERDTDPNDAARLDDPVETQTGPGAASAAPVAEAEVPRRGWAPPRGGRGATLGFIALAVIGVLLILYAWRLPPFTSAIEATENAYVRGQTTIIAPQVNGYVAQVLVQDFDTVRAGQVIARIDDRIYRQRVEQAIAARAGQIATLANAAQSQRSSEATLGGQGAAVLNARAQLQRAQADMGRVDVLV